MKRNYFNSGIEKETNKNKITYQFIENKIVIKFH